MKKEQALTILLAVLVIVSAVQAFQLIGLSNSISTGTIKSTAKTTTQASGGGTASLPSNLENLPSMVGGC